MVRWGPLLGACAVLFGVGVACLLARPQESLWPILWLPPGILAGVLVSRRTSEWPAWMAVGLVSTFGVFLATRVPLGAASILTVVTFFDAVLVAALCQRYGLRSGPGPKVAGIAAMLLLATLVPGVTGWVVEAFLAQPEVVPGMAWLPWFAASALGMLVGLPAAFAWTSHRRPSAGESFGEAFSVQAIVILVAAFSFFLPDPQSLAVTALAFLPLPVLIAVAYRRPFHEVALACLLTAAMASGAAALGLGPSGLDGNDGTRWLQAALAAVCAAVLIISASLRERDRLHLALAHYRRSVGRRVMLRTADLESTNRDLESFAYMVSHDLRAPLRAISSNTAAVREDGEGHLQADGLRRLDRVQHLCRVTDQQIQGMLAFARLGRGRLSKGIVDTASMVSALASALDAANPDLTISWRIESLPAVLADEGLLRQVFQNLFENAATAMRGTPDPWIEVAAERLPGTVRFRVRDNGPGLPLDVAQRLFEPFYRGASDEGSGSGAGIGLAIVKRIVERHGGQVGAGASPNGGAEFWFTLPASDPPSTNRRGRTRRDLLPPA